MFSRNMKKSLITAGALLMLLTPFWACAYTGETPNALAVYNRAADWAADTHTAGSNTHGNWSYYMIKNSDMYANGRGDSSKWIPIAKHITASEYNFASPLPAYAVFQAKSDRISTVWNKDAANDYTYREAETLCVFTVQQDGLYNVVGDMKWSTELGTDPRGRVFIGYTRAGQSAFNLLWGTYMLRDADNLTPFTLIDPASPVDVPGFANSTVLKGIRLLAGDKLIIAAQSGGLNYRKFNVHDLGVYIERFALDQTPVEPILAFNRSNDMAASVKTDNAHGTVYDPTGNNWQYWIKRQAIDRLDYVPGELEAYTWKPLPNVYFTNFFGEAPIGQVFETFACVPMFRNFWNRYPSATVNYNSNGTEPWIIATFKNPYPGTINYSVTGATTWEKLASVTADVGVLFEISKINAAFTTKTVLWSYLPPSVAMNIIHNIPDPALTGIDLAEGEYIAIALRGGRAPNNGFQWYNSALTIIPDISQFSSVNVNTEPAIVDGGISPAIGTTMFVIGQEITISAQDFAGACPTAYMFDHWEVDGAFYSDQAQTTIVVDADIELTAVFTESNDCGDACRPYPTGDVSMDCIVDLADFAIVARDWMDCTDPSCD